MTSGCGLFLINAGFGATACNPIAGVGSVKGIRNLWHPEATVNLIGHICKPSLTGLAGPRCAVAGVPEHVEEGRDARLFTQGRRTGRPSAPRHSRRETERRRYGHASIGWRRLGNPMSQVMVTPLRLYDARCLEDPLYEMPKSLRRKVSVNRRPGERRRSPIRCPRLVRPRPDRRHARHLPQLSGVTLRRPVRPDFLGEVAQGQANQPVHPLPPTKDKSCRWLSRSH